MDKIVTQSDSTPILETLAGALILAVGMGFGRFSFTGMYPLMVKEAVISVAGGSFAASANYTGYLIGALIVSLAPLTMSVPALALLPDSGTGTPILMVWLCAEPGTMPASTPRTARSAIVVRRKVRAARGAPFFQAIML